MKFVLVPVHNISGIEWGIQQWRATAVTPTVTTDVFFYADTLLAAQDHIRKRYPEASFYGGDVHQ